MGRTILGVGLSSLGAAAGAILGVYLFGWIYNTQGFYALVIPGAALGLGCHLASPDPSRLRGLACAVAAVAVGYLAEWKYRYWEAPNDGLGYFLAHLPQLKLMTHAMIAVGVVVAFWWGREASPWISRRIKSLSSKA